MRDRQRTNGDAIRKAGTARRTARRFTLIELMAALALSLIIAAVAATAFTQTSGVSAMAHARIDAMHNARAALRAVETDLRSAYIEPDGYHFAGVQESFEMLTLSGQGGRTGPARVRYDLVEGGGDLGEVVFRSALPARYDRSPAVEIVEQDDSAGSFTVEGDLAAYVGARVAVIGGTDNHGLFPAVGALYDDAQNLTVIFVGRTVNPAADPDDPLGCLLIGDLVAFNVTGFHLRYHHDPVAVGGRGAWDSTDAVDDTYRRLPQVVEVDVETVDRREVLLRPGNRPMRIRRLIGIGAGLTQ